MVQFGFHAASCHPDAQPFFRRSEKPALSEVEGISSLNRLIAQARLHDYFLFPNSLASLSARNPKTWRAAAKAAKK
jgi:hypothetical protein